MNFMPASEHNLNMSFDFVKKGTKYFFSYKCRKLTIMQHCESATSKNPLPSSKGMHYEMLDSSTSLIVVQYNKYAEKNKQKQVTSKAFMECRDRTFKKVYRTSYSYLLSCMFLRVKFLFFRGLALFVHGESVAIFTLCYRIIVMD